jgi:hypothetical protein
MSFLRKPLGLPFQADVRSIRRYEEAKHRIASDLVVYANAIIGDEDARAAETGQMVPDLVRKHGISEHTF